MNYTDFSVYNNNQRVTGKFYGVPIDKLNEFRMMCKAYGLKYKIRYRGPRNAKVGDFRNAITRQAGCLKRCAVTFTAYPV